MRFVTLSTKVLFFGNGLHVMRAWEVDTHRTNDEEWDWSEHVEAYVQIKEPRNLMKQLGLLC